MLIVEISVGVVAFVGSLVGLFKYFQIGALRRGTANFLDDWNGEPERPGYEGRPSFPERMTAVEQRTKRLNHDMRDELGGRMALVEQILNDVQEQTKQLKRNGGSHLADVVHASSEALKRLETTAAQNQAAIRHVDEKVDAQSERVTNHRRRNDEQVDELRRYLEQERRDLLEAKSGLVASVSELLMVDGHEQREQGDGE